MNVVNMSSHIIKVDAFSFRVLPNVLENFPPDFIRQIWLMIFG